VFAELLRQRMGSQVELSPFQLEQLQKHFDLMQRWNKVLNLTSIRETAEIVERHYCESLFLGTQLPPGPLNIADVGSGAGFPGIPVAILRPESTMVLIESHLRKSVFLREATRELHNTRVIPKRIEDITETFDWATMRAVKYSDIEKSLSKLTARAAILAGEDQPSGHCFTWNAPVSVPWGTKQYLWLGTRSST
jgi:16S rRNA (guanine527-N7)-methyltransferase